MNIRECMLNDVGDIKERIHEALATVTNYNNNAKDANLDYAKTLLIESNELLNGLMFSIKHGSHIKND